MRMSKESGEKEFDFDADTFNSQDVIDRIAYLEDEVQGLIDTIGGNTAPDDYVREREDLAEYQDELRDLQAFAEEAGNLETFVSDDYFETYAQELAENIGTIDPNASWPNSFIDWEGAADALKQDYTSVELRNTAYWAR